MAATLEFLMAVN